VVLLFSVHVVLGMVDPQFTSTDVADLIDLYSEEYNLPIGPGMAALAPRPEPENEEEEIVQAMSPGTHEVNIVFDFDPNDPLFLSLIAEDTMWNRYNVANQLVSAMSLAAFKSIECIPTYFNTKISSDYVEEELYKKMLNQRFKK
jgi:hypothetical protein